MIPGDNHGQLLLRIGPFWNSQWQLVAYLTVCAQLMIIWCSVNDVLFLEIRHLQNNSGQRIVEPPVITVGLSRECDPDLHVVHPSRMLTVNAIE